MSFTQPNPSGIIRVNFKNCNSSSYSNWTIKYPINTRPGLYNKFVKSLHNESRLNRVYTDKLSKDNEQVNTIIQQTNEVIEIG